MAGTFMRHPRAFFGALRRALGKSIPMITNDGFAAPDMLRAAGPGAAGLYTAEWGRTNAELPAAGKDFLAQFEAASHGRKAPDLSSAYAAAATEVLLDAIARSDGSRQSVTRQLARTHIRNGIVGDVAFNREGDLVHAPVTLYRYAGGQMRAARVITLRSGPGGAAPPARR
jgi:ABC-type branched-subunit amino acid transport system substrate-binding protein